MYFVITGRRDRRRVLLLQMMFLRNEELHFHWLGMCYNQNQVVLLYEYDIGVVVSILTFDNLDGYQAWIFAFGALRSGVLYVSVS